jgi:hypothetical protein
MQRVRKSRVAYFDSIKGSFDDHLRLGDHDNRTPIERWLDNVKRNLVVVRSDYYGAR